jgi:hypothetical protein
MKISFNITQKGRLQVLADIFKDKGKTIFSLNLKKENYTFLLAEEMKKVISDGNVLIPLKDTTIDIRRRGRKGMTFKSMTKPLLATGALHDSIKSTKTGIEMKGYGIQHAMGFKTDFKSMIPNKEVPRRRFHLAVMNEKTANRIRNEIKENVSKGLRKAIGAGMVTKIGR